MASGRRLGVAADFSKYSNYAVKWALENIVREDDTLVLIIVVKKTESEVSVENLWSKHGSPLIPFQEIQHSNLLQHYGVSNVSEEVLSLFSETLKTKKVEFAAKVYYGDAKEKLLDAVVDIPLDSLIMGSRGLGGIKKVILGSVSNYVVNNAPCPVTVVKLPELPIS